MLVERAGGGVLVGEQRGLGADLAGADEPGRARPGGLRGVRHQGLALQLGAEGADGPAAGLGVEPDAPPEPVEQPGDLAVAVEDGDVEAAAVLEADGVSAAALVVVVEPAGLDRDEAQLAKRRDDRAARGAGVGAAHAVQDGVADGQADQDGDDDAEDGGGESRRTGRSR